MSSKLDEMRNQFRQRLAIRSVTTSKTDVNRDHNQNIIGIDVFDSLASNPIKTYPKSDTKFSTITTDSSSTPRIFPFSQRYSGSSAIKNEELKNRSDDRIRDGLDLDIKAKEIPYISRSKDRESKPLSAIKSRFTTDLNKRDSFTETELSPDGTPCCYCGRSFALTERLMKHQMVCHMSTNRLRKPFDSMQQRFKGQPKEYLNSFERNRNNDSQAKAKPTNWRKKHEYCIAAIRSSKGESGSGPTAGQIMASMQQQCNYCKRRFNDEVIKRHLPICAKLYHKKVMNF